MCQTDEFGESQSEQLWTLFFMYVKEMEHFREKVWTYPWCILTNVVCKCNFISFHISIFTFVFLSSITGVSHFSSGATYSLIRCQVGRTGKITASLPINNNNPCFSLCFRTTSTSTLEKSSYLMKYYFTKHIMNNLRFPKTNVQFASDYHSHVNITTGHSVCTNPKTFSLRYLELKNVVLPFKMTDIASKPNSIVRKLFNYYYSKDSFSQNCRQEVQSVSEAAL